MWPAKSFSFCVNGRLRHLFNYLTDGVHHKNPFFDSPYSNPITPAAKSFNRLHNALRMDVERLYGVLTARFIILLHPGRFDSVEQTTFAGKAAAILHNLVVEQRRGRYVARERMVAAAAARDGEPAAVADDGHAGGGTVVGWAGDTGSAAAATGDVESAAAAVGDPFAGAVGQKKLVPMTRLPWPPALAPRRRPPAIDRQRASAVADKLTVRAPPPRTPV